MTKIGWVVLLFAAAGLLVGQVDTGVISGSVTDSSGAVVAGAVIHIRNLGTGQSLAIQTNQSGVYVSTPLRPGEYSVEAEASGFRKVQKKLASASTEYSPGRSGVET